MVFCWTNKRFIFLVKKEENKCSYLKIQNFVRLANHRKRYQEQKYSTWRIFLLVFAQMSPFTSPTYTILTGFGLNWTKTNKPERVFGH